MSWLRMAGYIILFLSIMAVGFKLGSWWTSKQVAELQTQLSKSQETIELKDGLYVKATEEITLLKDTLDIHDFKMKVLKDVLNKTHAELLSAQQVSLRWKKAYEKLLDSQQTEEPPKDPGGEPRKRVDFSGKLGPIIATGHTLTDPPEAFLKLEQVDPLVLTLALAQNRDGTWATYMTSSDDNLDVKIDLAGVNPHVLSPRWYQRLWVEASADFLGDPAGSVGLSYQGDRVSVGANCSAWQQGHGCGASMGFRIFK